MATNFKLHKSILEQSNSRKPLIESLTVMYSGNTESVKLCMEGVVDILGSMYAKMSAGRSIFNDADDNKRRMLKAIVAGAQVLKDYPEAAEAHNMSERTLRAVIQQADFNTKAAQALVSVAASAPTVLRSVAEQLDLYEQALQSGDTATIDRIKKEIQQLWIHWQRESSTPV